MVLLHRCCHKHHNTNGTQRKTLCNSLSGHAATVRRSSCGANWKLKRNRIQSYHFEINHKSHQLAFGIRSDSIRWRSVRKVATDCLRNSLAVNIAAAECLSIWVSEGLSVSCANNALMHTLTYTYTRVCIESLS